MRFSILFLHKLPHIWLKWLIFVVVVVWLSCNIDPMIDTEFFFSSNLRIFTQKITNYKCSFSSHILFMFLGRFSIVIFCVAKIWRFKSRNVLSPFWGPFFLSLRVFKVWMFVWIIANLYVCIIFLSLCSFELSQNNFFVVHTKTNINK